MLTRRLMETLAMVIIGDSVLAIVRPKAHGQLWQSGPKWWMKSMAPFVAMPMLARAVGMAGFGLGMWLACRQERPELHAMTGRKLRSVARKAKAAIE